MYVSLDLHKACSQAVVMEKMAPWTEKRGSRTVRRTWKGSLTTFPKVPRQ